MLNTIIAFIITRAIIYIRAERQKNWLQLSQRRNNHPKFAVILPFYLLFHMAV